MKKCSKCGIEKDVGEFRKNKKYKDGLYYICRKCNNEYDRERYRICNDNRRKNSIKYRNNFREKVLLLRYKKIDKNKNRVCNLTEKWIKENIISKECVYCGSKERLGIDRIDNNNGHTIDNSVPCCYECNTARMDNFTHQEMLMYIGPAIKKVKQMRNINTNDDTQQPLKGDSK